MEILFQRVYGLDFDSQEQHDHDPARSWVGGGDDLEGQGLLGVGGANSTNSGGSRSSHHHSHNRHHHGDGSHAGQEEGGRRGKDAAYSSVHLPFYSAAYGFLGHAPPQVFARYPNDPSADAARRSQCCYDYHQSLLAPAATGGGGVGEGEADAPTAGARHCHHHSETRQIVAAFQNGRRSVLTATMMEIGAWTVWWTEGQCGWGSERRKNRSVVGYPTD